MGGRSYLIPTLIGFSQRSHPVQAVHHHHDKHDDNISLLVGGDSAFHAECDASRTQQHCTPERLMLTSHSHFIHKTPGKHHPVHCTRTLQGRLDPEETLKPHSGRHHHTSQCQIHLFSVQK